MDEYQAGTPQHVMALDKHLQDIERRLSQEDGPTNNERSNHNINLVKAIKEVAYELKGINKSINALIPPTVEIDYDLKNK